MKLIPRSNTKNGLKFFFSSVAAQAKETLELITKINQLYDKVDKEVCSSKSPYLHKFLAYIFEHPVFYSSAIMEELKPPTRQWRDLLSSLRKRSLLHVGQYGQTHESLHF